VKDWEIIADNLSKAGRRLGWVSALDVEGRTMWIVDAHGYGNRFICACGRNVNCVRGIGTGDTPVRGEFDLVIAAEKRAQMKT